MLCPDVWQFSAPLSSLKKESGYLDNCCIPKLHQFNFIHSVSVILPDTLQIPHTLSGLLKDCEYYKVQRILISEFLISEFIEKFIKPGSLTLLSIERQIDTDDCFAITPEGILVLSLGKQSFQQIGLPGEPSKHSKHLGDRYIVKIDLKQSYASGGKKLDHIRKCLTKMTPTTVLMAWQHSDSTICPSSIAKYFYEKSYEIQQCTPAVKSNTEYSVKVPKWNVDTEEIDNMEFVEWLGMICAQADLDFAKPDGYITSYEAPSPCEEVGQVKCLNWTGYFTSHDIRVLLSTLIDYQMKNVDKPWTAIYIQGFSDTPVSWGLQENYFYTNGDNSSVIILQPSKKYLLYTQSCSYKQIK